MLVGVWKSPIGIQNLLRQTVITVIFTVPINFIHIQAGMPSKVYQSFSVSQNGVFAQFSTSWTIAPIPLRRTQQQCKTLYEHLHSDNAVQVSGRGLTTSAGCNKKILFIITQTNRDR